MRPFPTDSEDEAADADFKPVTAAQAQELRERNPAVSPWRVIVGQVVVGAVAAVAGWLLTGRSAVGWSMAWGALAVVIPAAVFARGLTGRLSSLNPGTAMFGFFLWEMVKLVLTVAMLVAAPRLVVGLSWPAMLVGLVVTMKASWGAVMLAPMRMKQREE
jgi:ATP synthase protein I